MLDFIKDYLSSPNHPMMDAVILFVMSVFFAALMSILIKWTFQYWAQAKQHVNLTFIFQAIRLPISVSIILIGINNGFHSFELSENQ